MFMLTFMVTSMNAFAFIVTVGENELWFSYGEGNTLILTYGNSATYGIGCATGNLVIPSMFDIGGVLYSVTSIASDAFNHNNCSGSAGLTSVTIPSTITSIGDRAFGYNTGLETVYFNANNCT